MTISYACPAVKLKSFTTTLCKVEEFYDDIIESQQLKVASNKGYSITEHSLTLYGKCPECLKSE